MIPPIQHSRINLLELKAKIVKKLGPDVSKQYFYYLNRFLSLKLNKVEFNNLCLKILGRENIPLHNHLIRSILRNACTSKTPPVARDGISNPGFQFSGKEITSSDNHHPNGSHSYTGQPSGSPGFANGGDMLLPISPKKARTGLRDRKGGDRRSMLGPNGKTNFAPQQLNDFDDMPENGALNPHHHHQNHHHHIQGFMRKSDNGKDEILGLRGLNLSVLRRCKGFSSPSCNEQEGCLEEEKESSFPTGPIRAPLGIPFLPVSGARRAPAYSGGDMGLLFNDGTLLDSMTLRKRMENIASAEGLDGVSLDSANLLNQSLDFYMKRLIRSCFELVGSRQGLEVDKSSCLNKQHLGYPKPINGIRPGYKNLVQNTGNPLEFQELRNYCPISLRDFRVAVEMNPRNLGDDWPVLLEKICINAFEE